MYPRRASSIRPGLGLMNRKVVSNAEILSFRGSAFALAEVFIDQDSIKQVL